MGQERLEWPRGTDDLLEHRGTIDPFAQREVLHSNTVFGPLELIDVSSCGIPADDLAVLVHNRLVVDREPAILSILTAGALLRLKRFAAQECFPAFLLEPPDIVGMETPESIPARRSEEHTSELQS